MFNSMYCGFAVHMTSLVSFTFVSCTCSNLSHVFLLFSAETPSSLAPSSPDCYTGMYSSGEYPNLFRRSQWWFPWLGWPRAKCPTPSWHRFWVPEQLLDLEEKFLDADGLTQTGLALIRFYPHKKRRWWRGSKKGQKPKNLEKKKELDKQSQAWAGTEMSAQIYRLNLWNCWCATGALVSQGCTWCYHTQVCLQRKLGDAIPLLAWLGAVSLCRWAQRGVESMFQSPWWTWLS